MKNKQIQLAFFLNPGGKVAFTDCSLEKINTAAKLLVEGSFCDFSTGDFSKGFRRFAYDKTAPFTLEHMDDKFMFESCTADPARYRDIAPSIRRAITHIFDAARMLPPFNSCAIVTLGMWVKGMPKCNFELTGMGKEGKHIGTA